MRKLLLFVAFDVLEVVGSSRDRSERVARTNV